MQKKKQVDLAHWPIIIVFEFDIVTWVVTRSSDDYYDGNKIFNKNHRQRRRKWGSTARTNENDMKRILLDR